jgi:hypothetical protein
MFSLKSPTNVTFTHGTMDVERFSDSTGYCAIVPWLKLHVRSGLSILTLKYLYSSRKKQQEFNYYLQSTADRFCFQKRHYSPTWNLLLTEFWELHKKGMRSKPSRTRVNWISQIHEVYIETCSRQNHKKKLIFKTYTNLHPGLTTRFIYIKNSLIDTILGEKI